MKSNKRFPITKYIKYLPLHLISLMVFGGVFFEMFQRNSGTFSAIDKFLSKNQ